MNENELPERPRSATPGTPAGPGVDVADADLTHAPVDSGDSSAEAATAEEGSADALRAAIEAGATPATEPPSANGTVSEVSAQDGAEPPPVVDADPAEPAPADGENATGGPAAEAEGTQDDQPAEAVAEAAEAERVEKGSATVEDPEAVDNDSWPTLEDAPTLPPHRRFDCVGGDVEEAAEAARVAVEAGECIVLPTDTVYGIGADAFSAAAVQRLLDAKGRGRDMPPPVLISDASMLKALSEKVPESVQPVVERFWPGALTIVVRAKESLKLDLGETAGTIGLRVPDHPLARDLLRRTGPLAVSSANRTGRAAAENVDQAIDMLGDTVAVYLDGGPVAGVEEGAPPSTIIDFTSHDGGRVLRVGAIAVEELRELLPDLIAPRVKPVVTSAADISAAILSSSSAPEPAPAGDPAADEAAADEAETPATESASPVDGGESAGGADGTAQEAGDIAAADDENAPADESAAIKSAADESVADESVADEPVADEPGVHDETEPGPSGSTG